MSRKASIFSVVVVMIVTVLATVAVAFAAQGEGGSDQENGQGSGQGNSLEKVTICHNGHTITVGAPGAAAHLAHHDGDTEGACEPEGTTPEPPGGTTTPTLATQAATPVTLGDPISDTAILSGGDNPTGTITFNVYGPDHADCSGEPAFTSTVDVNGNGEYNSDPTPDDPSDDFVPSAAGTYRWTADYSGDASNEAVSSECNADNEQSVVSEGPSTTTPILTTEATASATLGDPISDTATLGGATSDATGDITFKVYGPFDPTTDPSTDQCIDSGTDANLVTTLGPFPIGSPDPTNNGNYVVSSDDPADTTDDFAPTQAGRYQWVASYSGDANNEAVSSECNADGEQSVVTDTSSTTATEQNMTLAAKTGDPATPAQGNKDPDITNGTNQSDSIAGGGGRDLIRGLLASDKLYGDNGADTLYGNADDDFLLGGVGPDAMDGGPGDDYINGVDGKAGNDEIDGGSGTDHCVGDEGDTFTNCDGNVVKVTVPQEATAQKEASQ